MDVRIGSGVVRMIQGMNTALNKIGHKSSIIHPDYYTTDYLKLAELRIEFNSNLKRYDLSQYDAVIGTDFDGYAVASSIKNYFVMSGGILADIIRFESDPIIGILKKFSHLESENFDSAKTVFVPSLYSASVLTELYGVSRNRIKTIPLGIDLDEWVKLLEKTPLQSRQWSAILCVARHYPRKGIQDLLYAFCGVREELPNVQLTLIGAGPQFNANMQQAADLRLQDSVKFLGDLDSLSDVVYHYKNSDIFCLPSYHETFGLVYLEAMASGLPVIAYRNAAVPELVSTRVGRLCEPGNTGELKNYLLEFITNKDLRYRIGENGRRTAKDFTWEKSARKLADAISEKAG